MNRPVAAGIAAVLLGVTAAGAAMLGIFLPLLVLDGAVVSGAPRAAVIAVGVMSFGFGVVAAFAAWAVATKRPAGTILGVVIGAVVLLGAAVASVSGGWHPALWFAIALGGGTVGSLVVPSLHDRIAAG